MWRKNTIFLALIAALITNEVMAGQHVVGGSQGWDASTDFKSWVSGQTFNVGDQLGFTTEPFKIGHHQMQQLQQCRGIRVRVLNGNLEMALGLMQRKMQGSGIERMIKQEQRFHIKNSEKRVLAQKNLERRLRSEDYARKLKAILLKKVRGL
ncbi:uncharacterized protein HKW66_Vig0110860 [Vigna angularis]|uniref:Uncharacterized protein n=1 Tax=Phaseolus angularis TaxID=3914 RepID=A0A8T0KWW1_PHAAN|nr:uncharacterized protein HKW66_Vig0110860 [Vigna angularis]